VIRDEGSQGLGSSRAYSLALAPQVIHTKSQLLSQLVTSKAFRQIEFLAVGSFYILQPADSGSDAPPSLSRIPSTREDVFANTAIPARAKRHLMKFLKFVLGHEETPQVDQWRPQANKPLTEFLASAFNLDAALQSYVVALTLSIDGKISVEAGLKAIHKHISSMGLFGPGFAAVYPKWGGLSEVAQVGCRAGAVGGAVYMLGTGITTVASAVQESIPPLTITLTNDVVINAKTLVQESVTFSDNGQRLSKMIAIVNAALLPVFEVVVEGAPTPAVAIVAIPPGSVVSNGSASEYPVYLAIHSSDTGECPAGQCKLKFFSLPVFVLLQG
jgi:RAB protein geranylgeranyltransferase component A